MPDQVRLLLQCDAHSFDELIPVIKSLLKDVEKHRMAANASAVGRAGYVYRVSSQSDQPPELPSFFFDVLRQVAEAPSLEHAQRLARCALAISK